MFSRIKKYIPIPFVHVYIYIYIYTKGTPDSLTLYRHPAETTLPRTEYYMKY